MEIDYNFDEFPDEYRDVPPTLLMRCRALGSAAEQAIDAFASATFDFDASLDRQMSLKVISFGKVDWGIRLDFCTDMSSFPPEDSVVQLLRAGVAMGERGRDSDEDAYRALMGVLGDQLASSGPRSWQYGTEAWIKRL